jgi:hypothetical protein
MSNTGVSTLNPITSNLKIQGYSPVSLIGGTAHTINQETELGFTLVFTAGAAVEVTLEDSTETPVGTEFHLINASTNNAAAVTLVVSGGTNINGDTSDIIMTNEFGRITCKKYSTNNYIVFGDRPVLT